MAIRRVIDLPDLGSELSYENKKFMNSKFEISYLSNDQNMIYASRSVGCGALVSAVANAIVANSMLKSDSRLSATDGLWLSGEFIANKQTGTSLYDAELNFDSIQLNANNLTSQSVSQTTIQSGDKAKIVINGSANTVSLTANTVSLTGTVRISEKAYVNTTNLDEDKSIVNSETLQARIQALYNQISTELANGTLRVKQIDQPLDFPLLAVIYLDHIVESDSWKIAGSEVDLTEYKQLAEALSKDQSLSAANAGSWKYEINGNKLTLPTSEWFFQCIKDHHNSLSRESNTTVRAIAEKLPNITGSFGGINTYPTGGSYSGAFSASSYIASVGAGGKGSHTNFGFKASNSNTIYSGSHVQPNAVKMHVYFYVGKKSY